MLWTILYHKLCYRSTVHSETTAEIRFADPNKSGRIGIMGGIFKEPNPFGAKYYCLRAVKI